MLYVRLALYLPQIMKKNIHIKMWNNFLEIINDISFHSFILKEKKKRNLIFLRCNKNLVI